MNTPGLQAECDPPLPPVQADRLKLCVLIVEDDDADAYLIENALAANPNVTSVIRATDGVEALRLVDVGAVHPDLALIDLHMPRKSGFHLLVDFAAGRDPYFPMVVLTSSTAPVDAMRSRLRGAARVLTKPESAAELEVVLAATIQSICTGATSPAAKGRAVFDNPAPRQKIRPLN